LLFGNEFACGSRHKIKKKDFTRKVKLTFAIMMGLMIKKSSKSSQNSLNDMKLNGDVDYTVTNSAYTQARAKLNYTAFIEMREKTVELFYEDGEYNRYKNHLQITKITYNLS